MRGFRPVVPVRSGILTSWRVDAIMSAGCNGRHPLFGEAMQTSRCKICQQWCRTGRGGVADSSNDRRGCGELESYLGCALLKRLRLLCQRRVQDAGLDQELDEG